MDVGTLVDIFRAERNTCLLGTDAVRDGVDVPGAALRLIVFERVPWARPDILHRARRRAFGGRRYDEMIARLRLKQAYGRLIRRQSDHGAFVLLDRMTPTRLLNAFPEGGGDRAHRAGADGRRGGGVRRPQSYGKARRGRAMSSAERPAASCAGGAGKRDMLEQTALIYTMVMVSAADRNMTDEEVRAIGSIVQMRPAFDGYDIDLLPQAARDCAAMLDQDGGLDETIAFIVDELPAELRETAYALACEIAAADGRIGQEEIRLLELLRHRLPVGPPAGGRHRARRARALHTHGLRRSSLNFRV